MEIVGVDEQALAHAAAVRTDSMAATLLAWLRSCVSDTLAGSEAHGLVLAVAGLQIVAWLRDDPVESGYAFEEALLAFRAAEYQDGSYLPLWLEVRRRLLPAIREQLGERIAGWVDMPELLADRWNLVLDGHPRFESAYGPMVFEDLGGVVYVDSRELEDMAKDRAGDWVVWHLPFGLRDTSQVLGTVMELLGGSTATGSDTDSLITQAVRLIGERERPWVRLLWPDGWQMRTADMSAFVAVQDWLDAIVLRLGSEYPHARLRVAIIVTQPDDPAD